MENRPVLIDGNGERQLHMFPDFTVAGQCTATAKSRQGERCGNIVWDRGQIAEYTFVYVNGGDLAVSAYGPLPADVGHQYLEQRCRVHDTPDADAYCDPQWEVYDPARHGLTFTPTVGNVLGYLPPYPPVRAIAAALRGHLAPTERELLVHLLTARDA